MLGRLLVTAAALFVVAADACADPRIDYQLFCVGCHLADGSGLPPEVPSLVGIPGKMVATPAGREYIVRVPGSAQSPLTDAELADVLNWVLAQFSADTLPADFRPLSGREVGKARARVLADPKKFRREHWPDIDES